MIVTICGIHYDFMLPIRIFFAFLPVSWCKTTDLCNDICTLSVNILNRAENKLMNQIKQSISFFPSLSAHLGFK